MKQIECETCGKKVSPLRVDDYGVCFACCYEKCAYCGYKCHTSNMTEEIHGKLRGQMVCCGCSVEDRRCA